ncbi:S ribonuclease [Pyrus ussuriensis x Pyrus communis]|uniref:S ribonuclease n=1 Tax=Pyrus ussuriensis x Pyrus communis TaxID=2448454 RepID=A0A5N5FXJ6_9ROSA|nr:S ribonuclease [Pyrus ussuriensis x Pyrus communis]
MAESSHRNIVDRAATFEPSPHYFCKSSIPISIPISTNRLLPSLVQEPNRYKGGESLYMDFRNPSTKIREDHYPLPFIEPYYEKFQGVYRGGHTPPFHVVSPSGD